MIEKLHKQKNTNETMHSDKVSALSLFLPYAGQNWEMFFIRKWHVRCGNSLSNVILGNEDCLTVSHGVGMMLLGYTFVVECTLEWAFSKHKVILV